MTRLAVTQAREDLAELLNRVAYGGERVVLERRGRNVAALIPIEDLEMLELLEDELDLDVAKRALARAKAKGEKPIPWKAARKNLGL
jgi:prevent-host-death family protein